MAERWSRHALAAKLVHHRYSCLRCLPLSFFSVVCTRVPDRIVVANVVPGGRKCFEGLASRPSCMTPPLCAGTPIIHARMSYPLLLRATFARLRVRLQNRHTYRERKEKGMEISLLFFSLSKFSYTGQITAVPEIARIDAEWPVLNGKKICECDIVQSLPDGV